MLGLLIVTIAAGLLAFLLFPAINRLGLFGPTNYDIDDASYDISAFNDIVNSASLADDPAELQRQLYVLANDDNTSEFVAALALKRFKDHQREHGKLYTPEYEPDARD